MSKGRAECPPESAIVSLALNLLVSTWKVISIERFNEKRALYWASTVTILIAKELGDGCPFGVANIAVVEPTKGQHIHNFTYVSMDKTVRNQGENRAALQGPANFGQKSEPRPIEPRPKVFR